MSDWNGYFLSVVLPSLAIYGCLIWGLMRFTRQRQLTYLLAAFAPFAWWGCSVGGSLHAKATAERGQAPSTVLPAPADLPDTIVFEGRSRFLNPSQIKKRFGFRYAVYPRSSSKITSRGAPTMLRYHLRDRIMRPELVNELPVRHIALRAGSAVTLAAQGRGEAANGGPLELWYVDGDRRDLIGIYYEPYVAVPMFPPVLTSSGWKPSNNAIGSVKLQQIMFDFISRSLRRT